MKYGIFIGPTKRTILAARNSILDILTAGADQKTQRVALKVFRDVTKIGNSNFNNVSIVSKGTDDPSVSSETS